MNELTSFLDQLTLAPASTGDNGSGWYVPEGDCAVFHVEDVAYTRVRVDELLTLYRADDDGRIVGAQVKGVSRLPDHDGMGFRVARQGEVEAVWLLLATFARQPQPSDSDRLRGYSDAINALVGRRVDIRELLSAEDEEPAVHV